MIAIEIKTGGKMRFIGKAAIMPLTVHPDIAGRRAFYRRTTFNTVYSTSTRALSIDQNVALVCDLLGVELMINHLSHSDGALLAYVAPMSVVLASPVVDLGARPQYRTAAEKWTVYEFGPVPLGYTTKTVNADEAARKHAIYESARRERERRREANSGKDPDEPVGGQMTLDF